MSFVLDEPDVMMWGGELLVRDGTAAGLVTSAAWGAAIGASVGLAYVRHADGEVVTADYIKSGSYQVNVGGPMCGATVSLRAPFDPDGEKVRR